MPAPVTVPTLPSPRDTTLGRGAILPMDDQRIVVGWERRRPWGDSAPAHGYLRIETSARSVVRFERPYSAERMRSLARDLDRLAAELEAWQLFEAIEDEHRAELTPCPPCAECVPTTARIAELVAAL